MREPAAARATTTAGETERRWSLPPGHVLNLGCRENPDQRFFVYVPDSATDESPMFVPVHGISRNGHEHASLFARYCDRFGVVLVAPYFEMGKSEDYQRLGRSGRGPRADAALDAILAEAAWLTSVAADRIHLFGFSGGAQFAHRYVMAHPDRVARAVIAAAGWYTFPDPHRGFPYGIRTAWDLPDVRFDPEKFLRVPITVMVGDQDITNEDLRSTERVNLQQGRTRVERARNWVKAMRTAARRHHLDPLVSLELVPGGNHVFADLMNGAQLGDRVFASLFQTRGPRA